MKCRVVQAMLVAMLAGMFLEGLAQKNYYVVVGAVSTEGNAKEFKTNLPSLNADTVYEVLNNDNVVHLYVFRTTDEGEAIAKRDELKKALTSLNDGGASNPETAPHGQIAEPSIQIIKESAPAEALGAKNSASAGMAIGSVSPSKVKGQKFKFTISDPLGTPVEGKVHYVDFKRVEEIGAFSTQQYNEVLRTGRRKEVAVVCGMFGYKQIDKFMNFNDPSLIEGAYLDENGAWVVPYQLERLEKGDVSIMYNVIFHKDAVVMLKQSETDLRELLKMMNENPNYEITVHAHCNGKYDRKIIGMRSYEQYFDANNVIEFFGSAKELTDLRAEAVREYLVKNGIAAERIRTYAWGGRYMLVDQHHAHAKINDRIEIEIRKD
jgi:outer membrane protein OmpA-like peptidoglycan-associated protein